jgi:hypothetical protein
MIILLIKDDESYIDLEASDALGRRISNCPSTKIGVRILSKTQLLLARANKISFLHHVVQTSPGAHPATYPMGHGGGRGVKLATHLQLEPRS